MTKKSAEQFLADTMKMVGEGDPMFWRHAMADATVELLSERIPVTVENLIERLETFDNHGDMLVRGGSSKAAIEHLRKIIVK